MNKKESMPMLSDILRMVDRNKALSDLKGKYNHSVTYNTSRTILRYIQENTLLTAFAYNPGNAVVIFPKKIGIIAYSCFFEGFPSGESYSSFRWAKMKMEKAITLIKKKDIWEDSDYIEDAVYEDTAYATQWEELATGIIEYTSSFRNSELTLNNFRKEFDNYIYSREYRIYRLTSGRLRVEIDSQYFSYDDFLNIILFFREDRSEESVKITELPLLDSWQKVLSVDDLDDELLDQLKVQTISQKMKEAA